MAACPGCAGCRQGPDSALVCDACSAPAEVYAPYAVYMHQRGAGLGYVTEIRPAAGAPPVRYRPRERGRRTISVPACPRCAGELVRR